MRVLVSLAVIGCFLCVSSVTAEPRRAPADKKDQPAGKGGSVVGVVTAKGDNWIEVKADGEEKGRRYVPNWVSVAPGKGGPDKNMIKTIKDTAVGARVKLDWKFAERARVVKLEVVKKDDK